MTRKSPRSVKSGVTPEELAKAKSQLLRQFIERRRSALFTAILIGNYTVYFNDPNLINTIVDKEQAVTLEEVNARGEKISGDRTSARW